MRAFDKWGRLKIIGYFLFELADRYAESNRRLVSRKDAAKAATSILAASIPLFMIYNMPLACKPMRRQIAILSDRMAMGT